MTDLAWIWLSTIVTIVSTSVVFVLLAVWSAGGAAPWSIVPGLVRGRPVAHPPERDLPPIRPSTGATSPARIPSVLRPPVTARDGNRPRIEGQPEAELEDLGERRL